MVDVWDSLPNWVVMAKDNTFKCRLETYRQNQEMIIFVHNCREPEIIGKSQVMSYNITDCGKVLK